MALYPRFMLVLLYGWSYLCVGFCAMLKTNNLPERRKMDFTHSVDKQFTAKDERDAHLEDTMTEHMQMLYAKYNRAGFPFRDGNTVRSFKAHWGMYPRLYAFKHITSVFQCVPECMVFAFSHFPKVMFQKFLKLIAKLCLLILI